MGSSGTTIEGLLAIAPVVAFWLGASCLIISFVVSLMRRGEVVGTEDSSRGRSGVIGVLGSVALFLGVAAILLSSVVLTIRLLHIGIEVLQGHPSTFTATNFFSASGVWAVLFVVVACALRFFSTHDGRLIAPLYLLVLIAVLWVCCLPEAVRRDSTGGFERSGLSAIILAGVSLVLVGSVVLEGAVRRRVLWKKIRSDPDALAEAPTTFAGLASCRIATALVVGFLVMYHLLVPIQVLGSYRVTLAVAGLCSLAVSLSCFTLAGRSWRKGLGDAGFGLATLGVACGATLFVSSRPTSLSDRYPQLFNAMLVGFAIATSWWTWLSQVWGQQLDEGRAWTTAGRLIPHAKRFAFFGASMALLCGLMMAFWPRLPGIATMDHSYGRITAGFSANLFFLLVMLWCSRRLRRMTFHLLTVLVVASTAGFLLVRMLPFSSNVG